LFKLRYKEGAKLKRFTLVTLAVFAVLAGSCATSKKPSPASGSAKTNKYGAEVKIKEKRDAYDLIEVPYKDYGYAWSYMTYVRPQYPKGVAKDIYDKLWTYYVKTIERGDYDYEAFNKRNAGDPNWTTAIAYKDDPAFRFHGVCYQYADYFEMLIKKEPALLSLIDKGVLRPETAPNHKYWVYQEPNGIKYFIDPTWGDWTVYGTPKGQYAYNLEHQRVIEQSPMRDLLVEAEMRSWFFIKADAVGAARSEARLRNDDRSAHNL
jgi:hypothetical protein